MNSTEPANHLWDFEEFTVDADHEALIALDEQRNDYAIWQDLCAGIEAGEWETIEPTPPVFEEVA